ncbi:FMN-dependent NADH-azoreductase [Oxalobacteraceae bacterium OM1]|nr:FMN-dependent NADH-azoreductase [Oxalobacteraceae bacterium OM1]
MKNLLQINASLFANNGQSSRLADAFVAEWQRAVPEGSVTVRDIGAEPVPHLTAERFGAFLAKPEDRTPEQKAVAGFSDALIQELRDADVIVLGLPMYNFGVPSSLKAYFDHVARAGVTFRYTENGPEGLLKGKKVYVFAARGGQYAGTPLDTQTSFVRDFLRFIGMDDVEFVYAEGLALGENSKQAALAQAQAAIARLLEPVRQAA